MGRGCGWTSIGALLDPGPSGVVMVVPPGPTQFGASGQRSRCAAKSHKNLTARAFGLVLLDLLVVLFLVNFGGLLVGVGRCWSVLVGVGRCWSVLVGVGRCWSVFFVNFGGFLSVLVDVGRIAGRFGRFSFVKCLVGFGGFVGRFWSVLGGLLAKDLRLGG